MAMSVNSKIEPMISENAMTVLERRYLRKNESGEVIETTQGMFERVAENIVQADRNYDPKADIGKTAKEFYEMMARFEFLPNSPTLMNAGKELQQLSACFVLPVEDSMEQIFETIKNTALIHKSGGGTGFSFSRIRPKNDLVRSTKGVSSGPISFMSVFNAATETIKQGGTRRGANMAILRVDHPDILDFIVAKEENSSLNNFNISVALTEKFMEAVEMDGEYELLNPRTKELIEKLRAKDVFDLIVDKAWANGEPGIIFLDRVNAANPTPEIGEIESTNPCGEQPLLPYESCNLGSINLVKFVKDGKVDYPALAKVVQKSVHFLDNVIDMNNYPLKQIENMTRGNRKIGLGVMGFGHLLVMLGIPYNSDKGVAMAEEIMRFIQTEARKASAQLAKTRGAFPNWKGSVYEKQGIKIRNATVTTIAPTGTISMISDTSSGIEPLFSIAYVKNVMDNDKLIYVDQVFEETAKRRGFYSKALMDRIAGTGHIHDMQEIPKDVRDVFVTAHEITPLWHIKMQAAFQRYTDNAVSKTVNFANSATREDIAQTYRLAYKLACKGVTVYRDGSRESQVLNVGTKGSKEKVVKFQYITPRPRPSVTEGKTIKLKTGCGNLYVTINADDCGPCELFSQMGYAGGCGAAQSEAIARLVSLALRSGIDPDAILKQLKGIRCPNPQMDIGGTLYSCPDAIAKAIEMAIKNKAENIPEKAVPQSQTLDKFIPEKGTEGTMVGMCPEKGCTGVLIHLEGCDKCMTCGYSKCG